MSVWRARKQISSSDEGVLGGWLSFVDGKVAILDKPGLGVEFDYDQLARERYVRCPYRKRDDEAEMRKHVDLQCRRILSRW